MEGEGMVAVVRGLRDAGLAVTLLDGNRQYTLLPNSITQANNQRAPVSNTNAATQQTPQKYTADCSTESAVIQCDRDAQAVDGRYTSIYKSMHCNVRPTSPPVQLTEFPPQRPDVLPGHGNFQVGGTGSGATYSPIRASSPSSTYRGAMSWPDRGSVYSPRPSYEVDAFAKSLRKYPCLSPDRSSEIMERLINYTQTKGLSKTFTRNQSSPTRFYEQASHHTLEPKATYTRTSRAYEPEVTIRTKKNDDTPTRDRKNEHHERVSRNFDVRCVRDMSKRLRDNVKASTYPYNHPICPTIKENHDYQPYASDLQHSSNSVNMEIQAAVKMISKEVATVQRNVLTRKTVAVPESPVSSAGEDNVEGECYFVPNLDTNTSLKSIQTTFCVSDINLKPRKSVQTVCSTIDLTRHHNKLKVGRRSKSQEEIKVTKDDLKRSLLELIEEVSNSEKSKKIIRDELIKKLFDTDRGDRDDTKSESGNIKHDKCHKYVSTFCPSGCDYVGDFHELVGKLRHCYGDTKQILRSEVKPFRISEYRQLDFVLKDWINNFNIKTKDAGKYADRAEILSNVEDKIKELFKNRTKQDFDLKAGIVKILEEIPMEVNKSYKKKIYLHKLVDVLLKRMRNVVMDQQNLRIRRKVPVNRSKKILTEDDIRDFLRTHLFDFFNELNLDIGNDILDDLENELIDILVDSIDCIRCGHVDDASDEMQLILQDLSQLTSKQANYITQILLQDFHDILNNCNFNQTYMILHSNVNNSGQSTNATNDTDFSIGVVTQEDLNANLDHYTNQLCQRINEWLDGLNLPQIHDRGFREVVVNDLAADIVDRHKYIELNPNFKGTEEDELEALKYQIFKWINKLVGEENQETIGNAPQLMRKVKSVPVPMLTSPQGRKTDGSAQNQPFDPMRPCEGETGPNTCAEENLKLRPAPKPSCCFKDPKEDTCCKRSTGRCCSKETCKNFKNQGKETEPELSDEDAQSTQSSIDQQSQATTTSKTPAGQSPTGQASTGRASIGQAPPGQASTGRASTSRAHPGQAYTGQAPTGQVPTGRGPPVQAPSGQAYTGQAPTAQAYTDQAPTGYETPGQAYTGQAPTGRAIPGHAPTGQPPTGQTYTGQAPTGHASPGQAYTGQAPTGRAIPGHAPTGQPPTGQIYTGQAPTGHASPGQAYTGKAPTGRAIPGHAPTGQPPTGQTYTGQAPTGHASPGQVYTGQAPTGRPTTGRASTGQIPTGRATPGQAPTGQSPTDQIYTGQGPTGQSYTGQGPTGQAYTGQQPTGPPYNTQAPTGQAYTGHAPTGQATSGQSPTGQAYTGQAPRGQGYTGQTPTGQAYTGQAPTGQAYTSQAPTGQGTTGRASKGHSPTGQAYTGQAPTSQGYTGQTPTAQAPTDHTSTSQTPKGRTSIGQAPKGQTLTRQIPAGQKHTTTSQALPKHTPTGQTSKGYTPAGHIPAGKIPAGQVPAGQTSTGHETPYAQTEGGSDHLRSHVPTDQGGPYSQTPQGGHVHPGSYSIPGQASPHSQAPQGGLGVLGPGASAGPGGYPGAYSPTGQISSHPQGPLEGSGHPGSYSPIGQAQANQGLGSLYSKAPQGSTGPPQYSPAGHISPHSQASQGGSSHPGSYSPSGQVSPHSHVSQGSQGAPSSFSPADQSSQMPQGTYDPSGQGFSTTIPYGQFPTDAQGPNFQHATQGSHIPPGYFQNAQTGKMPYQGQGFGPPYGQGSPIPISQDPNQQWSSPASFSPGIPSSTLRDQAGNFTQPIYGTASGRPASAGISPGDISTRYPDMGQSTYDPSQSMYGTGLDGMGPQRFAMAPDPMRGNAFSPYYQSQMPSPARSGYQDSLAPIPPSLKQINDDYDEYLKQWVKQIPIPVNKPSEEQSAEKARLGVYNGVWKGVTKMKLDPDIFNDPYNYQDVFDDEIEALLKKVPKNQELEASKEMLKAQLLNKTMAMNAQIRSTNAPATFKQQLIETIEYNLPKRTHTVNESDPAQQQEEVEKIKLAENYILYTRFKDEDSLKANVNKKSFLKKLDELLNTIRKTNGIDMEPNAYANDIINSLDKVPVPNMNYMRDEADDILLGLEVENWISDLPLKPDNTLPLEKRRIRDAIAMKIQDIGSNVSYADNTFAKILKTELPKFLEKIPIQPGTNIDFMIDELANRIGNLSKYIRQKSVSFEDQLGYNEFSRNMPASSSFNEPTGPMGWGSHQSPGPENDQWHSLQTTMAPPGLLNWSQGPQNIPGMYPGEVCHAHPVPIHTIGPGSFGGQGGAYNSQGSPVADASSGKPCCPNAACTNRSHTLLQGPQGPPGSQGPYSQIASHGQVPSGPYSQGFPAVQGAQIPYNQGFGLPSYGQGMPNVQGSPGGKFPSHLPQGSYGQTFGPTSMPFGEAPQNIHGGSLPVDQIHSQGPQGPYGSVFSNFQGSPHSQDQSLGQAPYGHGSPELQGFQGPNASHPGQIPQRAMAAHPGQVSQRPNAYGGQVPQGLNASHPGQVLQGQNATQSGQIPQGLNATFPGQDPRGTSSYAGQAPQGLNATHPISLPGQSAQGPNATHPNYVTKGPDGTYHGQTSQGPYGQTLPNTQGQIQSAIPYDKDQSFSPSETAYGQIPLNYQGSSIPASQMPYQGPNAQHTGQIQSGYFGQASPTGQGNPHTGQAIPPEYYQNHLKDQPSYSDASAGVQSRMQTPRQNQTAQSSGPVSAASQVPDRTDPTRNENIHEMAGGGLGILGVSQEPGPSTRAVTPQTTHPSQYLGSGVQPSTAVAADGESAPGFYKSTDSKGIKKVIDQNRNQQLDNRPISCPTATGTIAPIGQPHQLMSRACPQRPSKKCRDGPRYVSDGVRKTLEVDETDTSTDKERDACRCLRRPRRCRARKQNEDDQGEYRSCVPLLRYPYKQLIHSNRGTVRKEKSDKELKIPAKRPLDINEKEIFNIKSVQTAFSSIDIKTTKCKYCEIRSKSQEELTKITKKQEVIKRKDLGRGDLQQNVTEWFEIHSDKVKVKLWGEKMKKLAEKLKKPGGEEKLRIKIEKYLKHVPEQFSEGDDERLEYRKQIPNDIIRKLKKMYLNPPEANLSVYRMELSKYCSRYKMENYRKVIMNWVKNLNIKKKDFLGRHVKKDEVFKYIADKLEPLVFDRPQSDSEYKIALKSNIKDVIDDLPLAVGNEDKENYINKVTEALINEIYNIESKVPSTYIQPTIKEIKEFVKDEITFFLEKSRIAISTKRMEYLETELVDLLLDLTDIVDIDNYVVEDVTTILKEIGKLPEYKAKYFTNLLLRDYKEFFFRESFFNERGKSDHLPATYSVFQNATGMVDLNVATSFDVYKQRLVEEITKWLSKVNIAHDENIELIVKDLASSIVDRHRYLVLNPNIKEDDAETIENLKYQIFKWTNKIFGDENTTVLEHADELMNMINNIPKPLLGGTSNDQCRPSRNSDTIINDTKLYIEILTQEIYDWFHELPMDLQMSQDGRLNTQLMKNVAEAIEKGLDRKDPEVIAKEVRKWTEKVFDTKLNNSDIEKLKHRIKSVPYLNENVEKDPKQEKVLIRSYEDIVDEWIDTVPMESKKEGIFINNRNEFIHELAVKICHIKSRLNHLPAEAIENKLQEKISVWMKKLPMKADKQDEREKYAGKLVQNIQERDTNELTEKQSMQTNQESSVDQLEGVILEWLKKNINLQGEEYQEEIMKEIANKIDAAICNRLSYPNEDIKEYIRMLDPEQNDEFIQNTALQLKYYLQELNMFGDCSSRDAEDEILISNIEVWLNNLPLAVADATRFENQKIDFIESMMRIKTSDVNKAVLKKEILTFMKTLPIDRYKKSDKRYLDKEASKLILSLTVESAADIANKSPLKTNEIISNAIRDWTNNLPLKFVYCPRELRTFIDDMSLVISTLLLDPDHRMIEQSDARLHREITKFLRRFPLQEEYSTESEIAQMAKELTRTLKDINLPKDRNKSLVNNVTVYGVSLENSNVTDNDFSIRSIQESDINANLNTYTRQLVQQIGIWFDNLNLPDTQREGFKGVVINDLAGDIVDRHKYLELNPDCKGSKEDELEHLKYQIFKWINKLVGEENVQTIANAEDLMKKVQEIPVPMLVRPQDKRQTVQSTGGGHKSQQKSVRQPVSPGGNSVLVQRVNPSIPSPSPVGELSLRGSLPTPVTPQSATSSNTSPIDSLNPTPSNCCTHDPPPPLPPPQEGTKEAIYDKYQKIFRAKCDALPIDTSTPDNAKLAELAKTGIYNGIVKTFFKLKSDPDIENDYGYFEFMLEEKIEEMLDILPQTEELKNRRHAWKLDILANAIDMLDQLHTLSDRPSFRQRVRNKFNRKFARDLELEECFLLQQGFLAEVADAYILETNYKEKDPVKANIYRNRLMKKVDDLSNHLAKEHNVGFRFFKKAQLARIAMKVLEQVPIPDNDILQGEAEEIQLADEVERWYKELPTKPYVNDTDAVLRKRMIDLLAKKLYDIHKHVKDPSKEAKMKHEMSQFLEKRAKLQQDQDLNINFMVDQLNNRIKNNWLKEPLDYAAFEKEKPLSSTFAQVDNHDFLAPLMDAAINTMPMQGQDYQGPIDHVSLRDQSILKSSQENYGYFSQPGQSTGYASPKGNYGGNGNKSSMGPSQRYISRSRQDSPPNTGAYADNVNIRHQVPSQSMATNTRPVLYGTGIVMSQAGSSVGYAPQGSASPRNMQLGSSQVGPKQSPIAMQPRSNLSQAHSPQYGPQFAGSQAGPVFVSQQGRPIQSMGYTSPKSMHEALQTSQVASSPRMQNIDQNVDPHFMGQMGPQGQFFDHNIPYGGQDQVPFQNYPTQGMPPTDIPGYPGTRGRNAPPPGGIDVLDGDYRLRCRCLEAYRRRKRCFENDDRYSRFRPYKCPY